MCHQDIFKPLIKICEILLKSQNLPIFLVLYIFFSVSTIKLNGFIHLIKKKIIILMTLFLFHYFLWLNLIDVVFMTIGDERKKSAGKNFTNRQHIVMCRWLFKNLFKYSSAVVITTTIAIIAVSYRKKRTYLIFRWLLLSLQL